MHAALERFQTDIYNADSGFSHDADVVVRDHMRNAIVRSRALNPLTKQRQYILGKPAEHQKIDFAMSSTLAHEAVMDAIADGALSTSENYVYY
jgi:hypothetical protein